MWLRTTVGGRVLADAVHSAARAGRLAIWLCVAFVSACLSEDAALYVRTGSAEVGKTLRREVWAITLVDQPEPTKQLGSGAAMQTTLMGEDGSGQTGIRVAGGMWLFATVEVTDDTGDLALLHKRLLNVTDAQGDEHVRAGRRSAVR